MYVCTLTTADSEGGERQARQARQAGVGHMTQLSHSWGQRLPPQTGRAHFQFLRWNSDTGWRGGGQVSSHTSVLQLQTPLASRGEETDIQHTEGREHEVPIGTRPRVEPRLAECVGPVWPLTQ